MHTGLRPREKYRRQRAATSTLPNPGYARSQTAQPPGKAAPPRARPVPTPERGVDRGERQAEGDEGGDGEDLPVVKPGVAERLDVGGRRVRVPGDLAGPQGHGFLLIRQPGVATVQNPRRYSGAEALPSFRPHASEQYESPRAGAAAVTSTPALAEVQTARRECLRHQPEQLVQGAWLVRSQPGRVPHVAGIRKVFVVERLRVGGYRGFFEKAAGHARSAPSGPSGLRAR